VVARFSRAPFAGLEVDLRKATPQGLTPPAHRATRPAAIASAEWKARSPFGRSQVTPAVGSPLTFDLKRPWPSFSICLTCSSSDAGRGSRATSPWTMPIRRVCFPGGTGNFGPQAPLGERRSLDIDDHPQGPHSPVGHEAAGAFCQPIVDVDPSLSTGDHHPLGPTSPVWRPLGSSFFFFFKNRDRPGTPLQSKSELIDRAGPGRAEDFTAPFLCSGSPNPFGSLAPPWNGPGPAGRPLVKSFEAGRSRSVFRIRRAVPLGLLLA